MTTGSPLSSSPNLFSNVTSTMPPLFPRPSTTNQLSKLDVLPTCSATEALMMPSFPPSIYSPSLPLFGHRYFSAINHAAAASLFPHQSSSNPFLRNGAGTIAQQLENDASTSSSIRSDALGKAFLQSREDFPSSRHTIDELSSRVLSQVRKWFYYFISWQILINYLNVFIHLLLINLYTIFSLQNEILPRDVRSVGNNIYETAAKLLFMSVKWAKSVPSFLSLPLSDQTVLLEESWAQLFLLNISQWSVHIDESKSNIWYYYSQHNIDFCYYSLKRCFSI